MLKATAGTILPTTITARCRGRAGIRKTWGSSRFSTRWSSRASASSMSTRCRSICASRKWRLDIVTDGDCRFDQDIGGQSWTSYPPHHMEGFDAQHPKLATAGRVARAHILHDYLEARVMPKIVGPVKRGEMQHAEIFKAAQRPTAKPVKFGTVTPELVALQQDE